MGRNKYPVVKGHVPFELRAKVENYAKENQITMNAIVIEALTAFFKQQKAALKEEEVGK